MRHKIWRVSAQCSSGIYFWLSYPIINTHIPATVVCNGLLKNNANILLYIMPHVRLHNLIHRSIAFYIKDKPCHTSRYVNNYIVQVFFQCFWSYTQTKNINFGLHKIISFCFLVQFIWTIYFTLLLRSRSCYP